MFEVMIELPFKKLKKILNSIKKIYDLKEVQYENNKNIILKQNYFIFNIILILQLQQ